MINFNFQNARGIEHLKNETEKENQKGGRGEGREKRQGKANVSKVSIS